MPIFRPLGEDAACASLHCGAAKVTGSNGSGPPTIFRMRPQSSAVCAKGPTLSSVKESGIALARLTRLFVGFSPVMPQKWAGSLIEPPVSEPSAAGVSLAATAAPEPEEEPPVTRSGAQGFLAWPR